MRVDKVTAEIKQVSFLALRNMTKTMIKILQSSAVTQKASGVLFTYHLFCKFLVAYICQKLRKLVDVCQSYEQGQSDPFLRQKCICGERESN